MLALGSHLEHNYGPLTVTSPISTLWVYKNVGIWVTVMAFITFWIDPGVGWIFPSDGGFWSCVYQALSRVGYALAGTTRRYTLW